MDYQTYRPMTNRQKHEKLSQETLLQNTTIIMYINQKQINPSKKNKQNLNHVCSQYWNLPNTSAILLKFQKNQHPPQDYSENFPFFQQNKNKQQTSYYTNYLSSDDDDYHQLDIFAPYTQEYCTQRPRQSQPSQNMKIYPQKPADMQKQQSMHIQNPINAQSFQAIQPQNPMTMHSYQPTQMQNEIPLPYYLQQHEITKINLQISRKYQTPQSHFKLR